MNGGVDRVGLEVSDGLELAHLSCLASAFIVFSVMIVFSLLVRLCEFWPFDSREGRLVRCSFSGRGLMNFEPAASALTVTRACFAPSHAPSLLLP